MISFVRLVNFLLPSYMPTYFICKWSAASCHQAKSDKAHDQANNQVTGQGDQGIVYQLLS